MYFLQNGVGFLDSGVGGLSVLRACVNEPTLARIPFFYFGDLLNAPYGNKTKLEITRFAKSGIERLLSVGASIVVLACNTATAVAVERLRQCFHVPIVGAEPAVLLGAKAGESVYVLTTRATWKSDRFLGLLNRAKTLYPTAKITPFSCDGLADAIEHGERNIERFLPKGKPDVVVLGCTHYVLIKEKIQNFYGVLCVDGNEGIKNRLLSVLRDHSSPPFDSRNVNNIDQESVFGQESVVFCQKSVQNPTPIFFLGEGKMVIKTKYEQMFA